MGSGREADRVFLRDGAGGIARLCLEKLERKGQGQGRRRVGKQSRWGWGNVRWGEAGTALLRLACWVRSQAGRPCHFGGYGWLIG